MIKIKASEIKSIKDVGFWQFDLLAYLPIAKFIFGKFGCTIFILYIYIFNACFTFFELNENNSYIIDFILQFCYKIKR